MGEIFESTGNARTRETKRNKYKPELEKQRQNESTNALKYQKKCNQLGWGLQHKIIKEYLPIQYEK